jgi:pilus assembly protein CpaE
MASADSLTQVAMTAIFDPDHDVAVALRAAIDTRQQAVPMTTAEALAAFLQNHPETTTVVLGPSVKAATALSLASSMRAHRPALAMVLVRYGIDSTLIGQAARSGVREVVDAGDTRALNRAVLDCQGDDAGGPGTHRDGPGQVVTVFSTKGGSGKTTLATNLAAVLADHGSRRVCLVDLDLAYGDVATSLHLFPEYTLADAAGYLGRLTAENLSALITAHSPGLGVLVAPVAPAAARRIPPTLVTEVIQVLRRSMDYVVVDTPAAFDDQVLAALDISDVVALIATLDIPALKNLKLTLETMHLLNYPPERWRVVINRADSEVGLELGDVQRLLDTWIAAQIPSSRDVPAAVNRGVPITLDSPQHPVSTAIAQFAAHCVVGVSLPRGTGRPAADLMAPAEPAPQSRQRGRLFGLRRPRGG